MVRDCNVNSLCRFNFLGNVIYPLANTIFPSNAVATFHMHIYSVFIFNQHRFNRDYICRLDVERGSGGFALFEDPA